MTSSQLIALAVLAAIVVTLIWDRLRSDFVALTGAAILLVTRVARPGRGHNFRISRIAVLLVPGCRRDQSGSRPFHWFQTGNAD